MTEHPESKPVRTSFGELASGYPPKLSRKLKLLLPLKNDIAGLLAKHASYDDIRILLQAANIVVSKNTVYRFCRNVIGHRPVRPPVADKKETQEKPAPTIQSAASLSAHPSTNIQTALQERRERLPGLWGRRKRGPRIANSKNL